MRRIFYCDPFSLNANSLDQRPAKRAEGVTCLKGEYGLKLRRSYLLKKQKKNKI